MTNVHLIARIAVTSACAALYSCAPSEPEMPRADPVSEDISALSYNYTGTRLLTPRIFLVIYDPTYSGVPLHTLLSWSEPKALTNSVRAALGSSSHNTVNYVVADVRLIVDRLPWFEGGWRYTPQELYNIITAPNPTTRDVLRRCTIPLDESTCPRFDYVAFANEFNLKGLVESNSIDEVWVMSPPWTQMYESRMLGTNAYWCNAPPETRVTSWRNFVVMGYNFERQRAEALHSYGHRAESILDHAYRNLAAGHLWDRFRYLNKDRPGRGAVGTVHFPINGVADYDYGNGILVSSNADAWLRNPLIDPDVPTRRNLACSDWSCSQDGYMQWWFNHFPYGNANSPNWWRYVTALEDTPVSVRPDACGQNTNVTACDNAGCAWYACSNSCWSRGTDIHVACPADSWCGQFKTAATCDANGCAFYFCSNSCWSRGTEIGVACAPCALKNDVGSCTQFSNSCAWYSCTSSCFPQGTALGVGCDPCRSYADVATCNAHSASCAWYLCTSTASKCWQRGTALSTACPTTY